MVRFASLIGAPEYSGRLVGWLSSALRVPKTLKAARPVASSASSATPDVPPRSATARTSPWPAVSSAAPAAVTHLGAYTPH